MVIKCDQNKYLGLIDLVEGFECFTECEIKGPEINVISILADFQVLPTRRTTENGVVLWKDHWTHCQRTRIIPSIPTNRAGYFTTYFLQTSTSYLYKEKLGLEGLFKFWCFLTLKCTYLEGIQHVLPVGVQEWGISIVLFVFLHCLFPQF